MTRTSRGIVARSWPALFVVPGALTGCGHTLDPGPVVLPSPPPLVCPDDLPAACPTPQGDPAAAPAAPAETHPIDLPTALRLADAQNAEVALARERIQEALARQELAELLWVPNLEVSANWTRHDGQIQRANGEVFSTSRSSAFVGGGAALNLDLANAYYLPLAARQLTEARVAGAAGVANEQLLDVAVAYIDLLQTWAELPINEEALANARQLLTLTENYEKAGKGAAADTARARTEVHRRERQFAEIQGRVGRASARLVQLLQMPPAVELRPAEPAVVPVALVPEETPLADLLTAAVANRPELAENRAQVAAVLESWRAAKVAPWVPSLRLAYAAGGFGGGTNDFFGDFGPRSDFSASVVWQLQNFGLGNHALTRERRSQYAQAVFRQTSIEARVAAQVVAAFRTAFARRQELAAARREVEAARESYRLNEERVRRAPEQGRPIELLQAIQALAQARLDLLLVTADYNRSQFRLFVALGRPPACALDRADPAGATAAEGGHAVLAGLPGRNP